MEINNTIIILLSIWVIIGTLVLIVGVINSLSINEISNAIQNNSTDFKTTWDIIKSITISNLNRKGMDVAQCYGASSSYARKYALNGLFLIDDTKDADATNNHGNASKNASTAVLEPNKEWLEDKGDKFDKAKQAIKEKGFTITDIRKKYKVSKKVEKLLLT